MLVPVLPGEMVLLWLGCGGGEVRVAFVGGRWVRRGGGGGAGEAEGLVRRIYAYMYIL